MKRLLLLALLPLHFACLAADDGFSGTAWDAAAQTAVVYNPAFPQSEELARYYAQQRGIPGERLVPLPMSTAETISRAEFNDTIRQPLMDHFIKQGWWRLEVKEVKHSKTGKIERVAMAVDPKVRVLALIRGVPLRVSRSLPDPKTALEDEASVDSELTILGTGISALAGTLPNPYYSSKVRFSEATGAVPMLLVGRLDGASAATVRRMVDDAVATEATGLAGRAVIDLALKTGGYAEGEHWLENCIKLYRASGIPTYVDRGQEMLREGLPLPDTALYFGWYGGEVCGPFKEAPFKFQRGAVACHLHSFSANTVRDANKAWAAPLLEHGAAATFGNVWEPYLSYTVHFDQLNERLLAGYTLAEAAWGSTPGLSWMNVVLGDPLYRPFANSSLQDEALRDYAILRGLAKRHQAEPTPAEFKRAVVAMAEKRHSPRLLESLGMLVAADGQADEAISLLDHARALYTSPTDQLRTQVYQIHILKQSADPKHWEPGAAMLRQYLAEQPASAQKALQSVAP